MVGNFKITSAGDVVVELRKRICFHEQQAQLLDFHYYRICGRDICEILSYDRGNIIANDPTDLMDYTL